MPDAIPLGRWSTSQTVDSIPDGQPQAICKFSTAMVLRYNQISYMN